MFVCALIRRVCAMIQLPRLSVTVCACRDYCFIGSIHRERSLVVYRCRIFLIQSSVLQCNKQLMSAVEVGDVSRLNFTFLSHL